MRAGSGLGAKVAGRLSMPEYVLNSWYPAAWAAEVGRAIFARTILDEPLIFYRTESGEPVALHGVCPHRFAPLDMGKLRGDAVECGYHGLQFAPSGRCSHNPHSDRDPGSVTIRAYPTVERHGLVWVWTGNEGRADPALIPDYGYLTAPGSRTLTGHMRMAANFELLNDNLLDLTHAQFTHANFFEGSALLDAEIILEEEDGRLLQRYECPATDASAVKGASLAGVTGDLCQMLHVHWQAPGFVRNETGGRRAERPDEIVILNYGSHLLTPETRLSTHYFFASTRTYGVEDEGIDEAWRTWHRIGFGEQDKPMIEAVQRAMGDRTDLMALKPRTFAIDKAAVRARQIVAELRKAEQGVAPQPART